MSEAEEDLIESEGPSPRTAGIRRRLDRLVPQRVGRRLLGGFTAAALALGLVAGYLVGHSPSADSTDNATGQSATATGPDSIPFVPDGSPLDEGVIIFTLANGLLSLQDLNQMGERALPLRNEGGVASGLDGLCGTVRGPEVRPLPVGAVDAGAHPAGTVSFVVAGAALNEIIGVDLATLAASTLRGQVQLAQDCASTDSLTVRTDGVVNGLGDEYAVFTVARTDPNDGVSRTGVVILVRVGGQLVEVSLAPEGGRNDVADGLNRAMRIAEVAVARMLGG